MSRCFPFPPPGYAGQCSSHEALILSIKLQKEMETALLTKEGEKPKSFEKKKDKDRKDKKRDREDRKDRKKDKKDKEERKKEKSDKRREKKAKLSAPTEPGKLNSVEKLSTDNLLADPKGKLQGRSELVERSSVTEEHGQPIDPQNVTCSSDSTGNSGKRRKTSSSPSGGTQSNGNIIRLRISSTQKRDQPSTSGSKVQEVGLLPQKRGDILTSCSPVQPCVTTVKPVVSTSKPKDVISNAKCLPCPASTSNAPLQPVSTEASRLKEKRPEAVFQFGKSSSHKTLQIKEHPIEKLSSHDRHMKKNASLYTKLFVDWVPPPLESLVAVENDDEDWLFGKKNDENSAKSVGVSEGVGSGLDNLPCSASYVMQPRACYLADAEVYALPFTVPF